MRYIDISPQANGLSKRRGQSAAAKAAYICRTGKYARHHDQAIAVASFGMPAFAANDAAAYWQAADQFERKNATIAFEYIFPLPAGLTDAQLNAVAELCAKSFSKAAPNGGALPVTYALHPGGGGNPHLHLLVSERIVDGRTSMLPADRFFRRFNSKNPETGGAQKASSFFGRLEEIKSGYCKFLNRECREQGLAVSFVTGSLEKQREQAESEIERFINGRDRAAVTDAQWWWLKTCRPVTSHRGPASNTETDGAAERLARYHAEVSARDAFLEEAAAAFVEFCEAKGKPVPDEAAELARKHMKRQVATGLQNFSTSAATNRDLIAGAIAALGPDPAPRTAPAVSKPQPVKNRPQPQQKESRTMIYKERAPNMRTGGVRMADANPEYEKQEAPQNYKAILWQRIYGNTLHESAASGIAYVYFDSRTIKTRSGVIVQDRGEEITATKFDRQSVALIVEQCRAKWWFQVEITGGNERVFAALAAAGIRVVEGIETKAAPAPAAEVKADAPPESVNAPVEDSEEEKAAKEFAASVLNGEP